MEEKITISAKELGRLALPEFCPRCFWLKLKAKKLPYQIFPGIFSSIDSYSKNLVHGWFDRHHQPPVWLKGLGEVVNYMNPPHHSAFLLEDKASGVCLKGTPDAVFQLADGSYLIGDYKTARYTDTQDDLLPLYEVQLNAYARIGAETGLIAPVSKLALIYTEPVTDLAAAADDGHQYDRGFIMRFSAHIKEIPLRLDSIPALLAQVREISDQATSPAGRPDCKECALLDNLVNLAQTGRKG